MSNHKNLLPSLNIKNHVNTETGEIIPAAYRPGHPRQYRFNASEGRFNMNGETNITKPGETFALIPLAIRVFKDNLFERGRKTWAEIFFLNAKNQVCATMLHGYSVENLQALESELFYEDLNIGEIVLKITPQVKTSKTNGNKFFIAEFDFEAADKELLTMLQTTVQDCQINRQETYNEDSEMIINLNYTIPERLLSGEAPPEAAAKPLAAAQ